MVALIIAIIINLIGAAPIVTYSLAAGPYAIISLSQEALLIFGLFQLLFTTYASLFLYSALSNFYSEVRGSVKTKSVPAIKRKVARNAPERRNKRR